MVTALLAAADDGEVAAVGEQHATTLAAGDRPVVLVGHAMGADIAALVAARHHDGIAGVVLVDGGLPLEVDLPTGTSDLDAISAVVVPAIDRLAPTYPDVAAHEVTFRPHPAFAGRWSPTLTAVVGDVNHDTTVFDPVGAGRVAAEARAPVHGRG